MVKCYLAHPTTDYGNSLRQSTSIAAIESRGWIVENPDSPINETAYKSDGMAHFLRLIDDCNALAFLRFADRTIGAGVGKEIQRAIANGLPVFEVVNGELLPVDELPNPILSVEDTRAKVCKLRGLAA